jgi:hypothetical protein
MKKYMIADMVKDLRSDSIKKYIKLYEISESEIREVDDRSKEYFLYGLDEVQMSDLEKPFQIIYLEKEYQINSDEAFYLTDNWDSEAEWRDVMTTAEDLNSGIEDVEDDDVEMVMELGGVKGEIESSLGKVFYWYNIALGTFILTTIFDEGNPANYPVSTNELKTIKSSQSFGEYFNKNIRANSLYSDKPGACGCIGDDPKKPKKLCTSEDFANMPEEFRAYI